MNQIVMTRRNSPTVSGSVQGWSGKRVKQRAIKTGRALSTTRPVWTERTAIFLSCPVQDWPTQAAFAFQDTGSDLSNNAHASVGLLLSLLSLLHNQQNLRSAGPKGDGPAGSERVSPTVGAVVGRIQFTKAQFRTDILNWYVLIKVLMTRSAALRSDIL